MRPLWTAPTPGECVHLEPAGECPICHPHRSPLDAGGVLLFLLLVAAIVVFGWDSADREAAFEDARRGAHIQRLEQHQPGAMSRLRDLAAGGRR